MSSFKTQLFALVIGLILVFTVVIFLIFRGIDKTRKDLLQVNKLYMAQISLKLDVSLWEDSFNTILEKNLFSNQTKEKKIGFLNVYFINLLEGEFSEFPGIDFGYFDIEQKSIIGCPPPLGPPLPKNERQTENSATWTPVEIQLKSDAIAELSREAIETRQTIFISKNLGNKYFLFYIHPLERHKKLIGTTWALMEFKDFYEPFRTNVEISLIFIILGIIFAITVGGKLRRNVDNVRSGLQKLKFDLSFRFSPSSGEIGEITSTINEMAATLSKVKKYTELILESTTEGVIAVDNEGKIVFFNKSASLLLQIPIEKAIETHYEEIFSNKEDLLRKVIDGSIEGKNRNILKTTYRMLSGKEIPVGISTYSLGMKSIKGIVIILRDLSDTERIERKLRQSDKLAALGKLIAGVAHEIKNPIAAIRANVQYWEKKIDKVKPSRESLEMVIEEVDRLNDIVNKWLIFSRERGSNRETSEINNIIEKTLELMKLEIEDKKINLIWTGGENLPPVYVNSKEIEQVIINIIKNAIYVLEENGNLTIKSLFNKEKSEIKIEISDSGPGIPLEIQGKIFDPFFTTKDEGTGLGLAISYDIILSHQGNIDLETILGKGTTFYVTLPASEI